MANRKGDDAGRSSSQPGAGVESGLSEKDKITSKDYDLADPVSEETAKPKPRGQTSAGGGFKWG